MPGAVVAVMASQGESGGMQTSRFLADDRGRFTANPSSGNYFRLSAYPADGQPYLVPEVRFAWTKGAVKREMDVKLPRGVLVRGKVTVGGAGEPISGASVQYIAAKRPDNILGGWQAVVASKDDGSYQIVVPPGKGYLFVHGPTADYLLESIGGRTIHNGQPGGERHYAHDIIPYEVHAADPPHEIHSRCGQARPSRAAWSGQMDRQSTRRKSSPSCTSTTSTSTGAATLPFTLATAPSSCTGSIPKKPLVFLSWTLTTSGVQRSTSPASRPART